MKPVTVYALFSSENGEIRYIGQTTQGLAKRLDSHIHCPKAHRNRYIYYWIESVRRRGFQVCIVPLREDAIWSQTEIELIAAYKKLGARLVNTTLGGEGNLGPRPLWVKKKISEARKGMKFSPEHCASMARSRKGRRLSEEAKAKVSAALKGRMPKNILLIQERVRGKPKSEEHKMKLRDSRLEFERRKREHDLAHP